LKWSKYKNTTVYHLLKNNALSFARSGLLNGGGKGIVNATQHDHGPSWRMIVEMTTPTNAYGIYPGGQSGNPGSIFYDNFINDWTKGLYFKLFIMDPVDVKAGKFKWKMSINPA
jgi:penicillin amidase